MCVGAQIPAITERSRPRLVVAKSLLLMLWVTMLALVPPTRVSRRFMIRTTHKFKTQQVARNRGQRCGDIELTAYLANAGGLVPLVLDLRIAHERWGSSSNPSLHGQLHYPADLDSPLNEATVIQYRADFNVRPPHDISFMPAVASTSDQFHCELVSLLFWVFIMNNR